MSPAAFEPTVLVVGGSIAGAWDLLVELLQAGIAEAMPARAGHPALVRVELPTEAPLLGAAYVATAAVGTA